VITAVIWDFGGVILSSPFEAFARYEAEIGLPTGFIRTVNATNPDANAWAQFERNDVSLDEFAALFEGEAISLAAATELTPNIAGRVSGHRVIEMLSGSIRPEMVAALRACRRNGIPIACLTNNIVTGAAIDDERSRQVAAVMSLFDHVVESSKIGARKPEPRAYEITCSLLGVSPHECVFLDDLGINLKPARALGMTTIKVVDPADALRELEAVLGFPLRD
jgi:putative hydrolase of the HAD superfamily